MQESYEKGVANHLGPELCVASREAGGEALVGDVQARYGAPKVPKSGVPTLSPYAEGHIVLVASARGARTPRGRRP